jgi:hypothetical protein
MITGYGTNWLPEGATVKVEKNWDSKITFDGLIGKVVRTADYFAVINIEGKDCKVSNMDYSFTVCLTTK